MTAGVVLEEAVVTVAAGVVEGFAAVVDATLAGATVFGAVTFVSCH